jgi:predicted metal-dependent phosphoesterase TrpH
MIQDVQGVPVLAHPFTLGLNSPKALKAFLQELADFGLAGLEVFYPEHSPEQEALYLKLAREMGLLVTGGSDFHGLNKPEVKLGRIWCQPKLTYHLVEAMKSWRARRYGVNHI